MSQENNFIIRKQSSTLNVLYKSVSIAVHEVSISGFLLVAGRAERFDQ